MKTDRRRSTDRGVSKRNDLERGKIGRPLDEKKPALGRDSPNGLAVGSKRTRTRDADQSDVEGEGVEGEKQGDGGDRHGGAQNGNSDRCETLDFAPLYNRLTHGFDSRPRHPTLQTPEEA